MRARLARLPPRWTHASMETAATNTPGLALSLMALMAATSAGCTASHTSSDIGPDSSEAAGDGGDSLDDCGFVARNGECPEACSAITGVTLDPTSMQCALREDARPLWCSAPGLPALGAEYCALLPEGEMLVLSMIPGDLGDHEPCSPRFCLPQ